MSGPTDRRHPLRDALLELPDLPRLSEEIRAVLRVEKARRQAFRDPSTQANDRGVKFDDYERSGVRGYWLVDPEQRTADGASPSGGRTSA